MLAEAGLKVPDAAKALQVTERTIYAWISGKTAVPYSAYRLLRVMHCFELPGRGWDGWSMHSGKLWTPEGFGFDPLDGAWWSLLVRQARAFRQLYERSGHLERRLADLAAPAVAEAVVVAGAAAGRASAAPHGRAQRGPNSLLRHFGTGKTQSVVFPSVAAMTMVAPPSTSWDMGGGR